MRHRCSRIATLVAVRLRSGGHACATASVRGEAALGSLSGVSCLLAARRARSGGAAGAGAVEGDAVGLHVEAHPVGNPIDGSFQPGGPRRERPRRSACRRGGGASCAPARSAYSACRARVAGRGSTRAGAPGSGRRSPSRRCARRPSASPRCRPRSRRSAAGRASRRPRCAFRPPPGARSHARPTHLGLTSHQGIGRRSRFHSPRSRCAARAPRTATSTSITAAPQPSRI
jgi:hypothetical protein